MDFDPLVVHEHLLRLARARRSRCHQHSKLRYRVGAFLALHGLAQPGKPVAS